MRFKTIMDIILTKYRGALEYYNKNGLKNSILYSANYLGFNPRTLIFFEMNIESRTPCKKEDFETELKRVTEDDILEIEEYNDGWFTREQALMRLKDGHILLAIKKDNRLVYFQWIELNCAEIRFFNYPCILPDTETVYMTSIYTIPEYRRQGIASKAKRLTMKYLYECGFKKAFLVIEPHNIPSIKTNKKTGFLEYQLVTYKNFPFWEYYHIVEYNSKRKKNVWTIPNLAKEKHIWRTFSKIS